MFMLPDGYGFARGQFAVFFDVMYGRWGLKSCLRH